MRTESHAKKRRRKEDREEIFCFENLFMVFWLVFPLRLSVLSDSGRENRSGGSEYLRGLTSVELVPLFFSENGDLESASD